MTCLSEVRAEFTENRNFLVLAESQTIAFVEAEMFRNLVQEEKDITRGDGNSEVNVPTLHLYCGM